MKKARLDIEYLAFRAGLKPAIRLSAKPGQGDAIAERYAQLGCAIARATGLIFLHERELLLDIVYVARTQAEADGLRSAEAPTLRPRDSTPIEAALQATRDVGLRLGYPPCCIEACCSRLRNRRMLINLGGRLGRTSQAYHAVRDAWVPSPRWQLNDLLFTTRKSIVSFEPCSYACEAALAYANAVLDEIGKVDRDARDDLERSLRRGFAVNAGGARAAVTVTRTPQAEIARAEPLRDDRGHVLDEASERFSSQLLGASIDARGLLRGAFGQPPIVVEFA